MKKDVIFSDRNSNGRLAIDMSEVAMITCDPTGDVKIILRGNATTHIFTRSESIYDAYLEWLKEPQ